MMPRFLWIWAASAPLPLNTWQAMGEKEQLARIDRWSEAPDLKQLESTLLEFPLELKTQLAELQRLRQIYNIQQVLTSFAFPIFHLHDYVFPPICCVTAMCCMISYEANQC